MAERIVLTGISGFIAKHVALRLLQAGYEVRGTVRRLDRAEEVRAALRPHLDASMFNRLCFSQADLESDEGWAAVLGGAAVVVHTASPFPIEQPSNEQLLIRPAVQGTLRVLRLAKAAGISRIVLTSSTAAVLNPAKPGLQDERDWCDPAAATTSAYARSKIFAERAAWDFAGREAMRLTVINPGLVLGPPLDRHFGASVGVVRRILRGRDPMMPQIGLAFADVRDVAEMHLRAVQRPQTVGQRYVGVAGSMTMPDMARLLKQAYPKRRIPTMVAPRWMMQVYALWDPQVQAVMPILGYLPHVSSARARDDLGIDFIAPADALRATAAWLVAAGEV